jgi:hypothetical protein
MPHSMHVSCHFPCVEDNAQIICKVDDRSISSAPTLELPHESTRQHPDMKNFGTLNCYAGIFIWATAAGHFQLAPARVAKVRMAANDPDLG